MATIERNHSIDSLKLICAFLVVFIHCEYPYKGSVIPITDVAVPLFFCISGYFVYGANRSWGRIKRILKIFAWSAALYLAKTEIFHLFTSHSLWVPTFHNIISFVCFNDVAFSIHLWYLPAYIYVLIIALFIDKFNLWKIAFIAIIPLLLIGVSIKYSIADICPAEIQYYRNAYFNGLPYFLLGAFCKANQSYFTCKSLISSRLFTPPIIVLLFVVRYLLSGSTCIILAAREMDLLMLTFLLFYFTINITQSKDNVMSWLGRKYSLYIYIFHLLIISIVEMGVMYFPAISNMYMYVNPICVFLLSIVFTYVLSKCKIIKV